MQLWTLVGHYELFGPWETFLIVKYPSVLQELRVLAELLKTTFTDTQGTLQSISEFQKKEK